MSPAALEAGKRTLRTTVLRKAGHEHLWDDALSRVYTSMVNTGSVIYIIPAIYTAALQATKDREAGR